MSNLYEIVTLFILIVFSLFVYLKILNIKNVGIKKHAGGIAFSWILSWSIFTLSAPMSYIMVVIMIFIMGAFAGIMTRTRFALALTGIMISLGISYGFSLVFALISAFILWAFFQAINIFVMIAMSFVMQLILILLLFRIERFKNGMPFIQEWNAGIFGAIVGGIILMVTVLIGNMYFAEMLRWQLLICGVICAARLIFWWLKELAKLYQKWMRERSQQEYDTIIIERDELRKSNDSMASLIHRDNKLLPAMHQTVKTLYNVEFADIDIPTRGKHAMEQLDELMAERTCAIVRVLRNNKSLPPTGNDIVDGLMKHMLLRATGREIEFDLNVVAPVSELIETIVPTVKFETLCADLIDNAIIATSHSAFKKILITLGINKYFYELNIQDSGIPFEINTLMSLGIVKASTRLDEGGRGIGYMTIFEILREYNASLTITEYEPKQYGFTKSVKVRFDNRGGYFVHTFRAKQLHEAQGNLDERNKDPTILNI